MHLRPLSSLHWDLSTKSGHYNHYSFTSTLSGVLSFFQSPGVVPFSHFLPSLPPWQKGFPSTNCQEWSTIPTYLPTLTLFRQEAFRQLVEGKGLSFNQLPGVVTFSANLPSTFTLAGPFPLANCQEWSLSAPTYPHFYPGKSLSFSQLPGVVTFSANLPSLLPWQEPFL
jgi:hypothetical protein